MSKPNNKYQFFPFVGQMEDTKPHINKRENNDIQYSNAILYPKTPYSKSKLKRKRRLDKLMENSISMKRLQRLKDSLSSDLMDVDKENIKSVASAAEPHSINNDDNSTDNQNSSMSNETSTSNLQKQVMRIVYIKTFLIIIYNIFCIYST